MNLINSFTSGFNFNLGGTFFNGRNVNSNNINYEYQYQDSDNSDSDEGEFDEENDNEEENEEDVELFNKKKNMFIMELDEFQYKHLKKYSALIVPYVSKSIKMLILLKNFLVNIFSIKIVYLNG